MADKKKQSNDPSIKPKTSLSDDELAQSLLCPSVQAAYTISTWQPEGDFPSLLNELGEQFDKVVTGDMTRVESMLICQAHALDNLFNNLARRAHCQEHMPHYETFLRLALKAQGQCRSTLETLAAIKNPPVVFAKQANISNNQQINNGVLAPSHAEKNKNQQNELLEHTHGKRLDTRTKGQAIGVNSELAALD